MATTGLVLSPAIGRPRGHYSDAYGKHAMLHSSQPTNPEMMETGHIAPAPLHSFQFPFPSHMEQYLVSPADFIRQSHGRVHRVVAGTIVMHNISGTTKVLLMQRSSHDYMGSRWEVPGGSCDEDDQSIVGAAARELQEEAGLQIAKVLDIVEDDHEWIDHDKVWRKMTFLVEAVASVAAVDSTGTAKLDYNITTLERGDEEHSLTGANDETHILDNNHSPSDPIHRTNGTREAPTNDRPQVTLDPNEHEDYVWASEAEVQAGTCEGRSLDWTTPEQKAAVLRAFTMVNACAEKHAQA
ncbi:NUDIX hydrolase domain-like protein [Microdochium trichocladiopsis]|uniref:NUDIX hydrolase domain-like protein n=1 Tax=Microdochium trichocladiopsis TaxID=1682393 RepID=A0A9P8YJ01_9PEZI|nr:NUDIX hydrolase domain-like protein [Microdochium trichocladiopsis]KAH7039909.1 NUDIX hydrolase domain-like protein [Microdochium trichocladiopsis]